MYASDLTTTSYVTRKAAEEEAKQVLFTTTLQAAVGDTVPPPEVINLATGDDAVQELTGAMNEASMEQTGQ